MKIYLINELSYSYNDEYYSAPDDGGGKPIQAWQDKTKAQSKCYEMNRDRRKESSMKDENGREIIEFYEVVELQVEDVECE